MLVARASHASVHADVSTLMLRTEEDEPMIPALDQPPSDDESDVATLREPMLLRRKRGRPLEMTQSEVLARIRQLAATANGLFRIHHTHSDLYARARRQFGSWAAAVAAAGV